MVGLVFSSFWVLPPLELGRVVFLGGVCGSLADLPGPPRRGPLGTFPRGRLSSHNPCWYPGGILITATGGLSLAPNGFSNHGDLVSGGTAANLSAVSYLPRNAASDTSGREFFWAFLAAGFGATEVRTSATTPFLAGPDATFRHATRCGGSRHQGAGRVSSPPRGYYLRDLGPTCRDRGISVVLTRIFSFRYTKINYPGPERQTRARRR